MRRLLPADPDTGRRDLPLFKGKFPRRVSKGYSVDRYLVVGDAAGFIRPFKGKGINTALLSGVEAAHAALEAGISRDILAARLSAAFKDVFDDRPYSAILRWLATKGSSNGLMDSIIAAAAVDDG